jgi:peptidoglycan/xylan/chitin deacetylase (PgdA/CDA1 family)
MHASRGGAASCIPAGIRRKTTDAEGTRRMSSRHARALTPVLLYREIVTGPPATRWQVSASMLATDLDAVVDSGRTVRTASSLNDDLSGAAAPDRGLCALTFDDGDASFCDLVLPLLLERGLPATVYVATATIGHPRGLSAACLAELARADVEVGAHTVLHRDLDLLPDPAIRCELQVSRDHLAELLGTAPRSFAYPYGAYHRIARDLVSGAGYDSGYAVKNALTHAHDDRYARARLPVLAGTARRTVEGWLAGRGAPPAWRRERLRTKAFRHLRAALART